MITSLKIIPIVEVIMIQKTEIKHTAFQYFRACAFVIAAVLFAYKASAQVVTGRISGPENEPVPYATIFVTEAKEGTITNAEGNFRLQLPRGNYHFTIRSMGFVQMEKEVYLNTDSLNIDIAMQRQEFEIKEVKVFPGKEDPAWFIMRKAMAKAPFYREKIKHYEADLYLKSNFVFSNIPRLYQNRIEVNDKKLKEVLKENVTYVIESQNKITYDYPQKYDQQVISKKSSLIGFDEPPVMGLMTASFYDERPNEVISPLAPLALRHYNFRYEGFITVGKFDVFKIKVTPKRKSDELVEGYIYIVDQLWCIYNLDFNSRFEFFNYRIKQQFENLGNNNWLPVSNIMDGNFSMLGLRGQFYYGASLKYTVVEENNFPSAKDPGEDDVAIETAIAAGEKEVELRKEMDQILAKEELTNADVKKAARLNRKILKEQYLDSTITTTRYGNYNIEDKKDSLIRDTEFWDTVRTIPLSPAEIRSYQVTDSLMAMENIEKDSITGNKKSKTFFSKIVGGHPNFLTDSLKKLGYDGLISPANFDFNTVDGYKYKQKLRFSMNPDSGKYYSISPELGYAFHRKALFGSVRSQFSNIFWNKSRVEIGFGKESRDFKSEGLGIHPGLNSISSWFFAQNYMKLYETSFFELNVAQRTGKNLQVLFSAYYNHFYPLENNASYVLSEKKEYSPNIPGEFSADNPAFQQQKSIDYAVGLNYRKRKYKPWLQESPFLFMSDFYEVTLQFKQGLKNLFSSVSDFSQLDFRIQQQANISPSAGIDWQINTGHFFGASQMHFSQFKHFRTAEIAVPFSSFTHTFQLLNDYEFSTNKSYFNLGAELRTEYVLLRYLSFINQKTWSESFHLNYLSTSDFKNYWETGYSLNSLFFVGNIGIFTGFRGNKFESAMVKVSISGF
ncbi:MAG: DUF5686 and carboxypeptidase regulatory-like domain-containing protein [Mariniphaga sp.]|nr:DUF5686 and carboxypeptidase regulatory-like domain-containing protein [Mariniphaga sp.]